MKQSSKLLFASLLSLSFASFAMDQEKPASAETPMDAFKRDIAELDNDDFKALSRCFKGLQHSIRAFSNEAGIGFNICQGLIYTAASQELLKNTPIKPLLEKYSLPCARLVEADATFDPEEASCIHPVVLSMFSTKFQQLIQKRKTALIQHKIEDGEEVEKWTSLEKKAFGMGLLNTELKMLKAEFQSIHDTILPFHAALREIKAERKAQAPDIGDPMMHRLMMAMLLHDMLRGEQGGIGIRVARQEGKDNSPKPDQANKKK